MPTLCMRGSNGVSAFLEKHSTGTDLKHILDNCFISCCLHLCLVTVDARNSLPNALQYNVTNNLTEACPLPDMNRIKNATYTVNIAKQYAHSRSRPI